MRSIVVLIVLYLAQNLCFSQSINFSYNNYAKALADAKKSNKIIFMDCHATWCGPCKMMDAKVFNDSTVYNFFNQKFVNAKMDVDETDGIKIARQFQIDEVPTFLFLSPDGKIIRRLSGFYNAKHLLEQANEVLLQK